jgi:glycosyltransferase involved in cell wall biosynthesis
VHTLQRRAQSLIRFANRHAGVAFAAGVVAAAYYNWRIWRLNKADASRHYNEQQHLTPHLSRTPKVSVLVAAWNEADHIDDHIRSFLSLSYRNSELIVCAGGSGNDDTLARARSYGDKYDEHIGKRVIVLEQQPGEGKQRALARCWEHATGEVIYLTDADCRFDDLALQRVLEPIVAGERDVATGTIRPLKHQEAMTLPFYVWATDMVVSMYRGEESDGILGQNVAISRRAVEKIGGLDFPAPTGTDYHLAQRLLGKGFSIQFVRHSVVPADYAETLSSYRARQARWLRNLVLYGLRYGSYNDVLITLRTMAIGTAMIITPAGAVVIGRSVLVPWGMLLTHATLSKLRYAACLSHIAECPLPAHYKWDILFLTMADFAIWASPFLDLLNPKRWEQW